MSKTTTYADTILDLLVNKYVGLLKSVADKEAGTVTEVQASDWSSYARQQLTAITKDAFAGGRRARNTNALTYPQRTDAGSVDVDAFGIFSASTGGTLERVVYMGSKSPVLATADATSDALTAPGHGLAADDKVRIEATPGGTLPTGLSENTTYFVHTVATDTFELSTAAGGSGPVNITANGACVVTPLSTMTIGQNTTPQFAANALSILED